jgi:hypothetical protein
VQDVCFATCTLPPLCHHIYLNTWYVVSNIILGKIIRLNLLRT